MAADSWPFFCRARWCGNQTIWHSYLIYRVVKETTKSFTKRVCLCVVYRTIYLFEWHWINAITVVAGFCCGLGCTIILVSGPSFFALPDITLDVNLTKHNWLLVMTNIRINFVLIPPFHRRTNCFFYLNKANCMYQRGHGTLSRESGTLLHSYCSCG